MKSTVLEDFAFIRGNNGPSKWLPYLDGRIHRIELEGRNQIAARAALLRQAQKQGLKIHASLKEEGVIVVQAYTPNGNGSGA